MHDALLLATGSADNFAYIFDVSGPSVSAFYHKRQSFPLVLNVVVADFTGLRISIVKWFSLLHTSRLVTYMHGVLRSSQLSNECTRCFNLVFPPNQAETFLFIS